MSAVGTTLLHSPGWRECQRHEQNPGYTQTTNNMSSIGAALSARVFVVGSAAPKGAQYMLIDYYPRACALGYAGVSP